MKKLFLGLVFISLLTTLSIKPMQDNSSKYLGLQDALKEKIGLIVGLQVNKLCGLLTPDERADFNKLGISQEIITRAFLQGLQRIYDKTGSQVFENLIKFIGKMEDEVIYQVNTLINNADISPEAKAILRSLARELIDKVLQEIKEKAPEFFAEHLEKVKSILKIIGGKIATFIKEHDWSNCCKCCCCCKK